MSGATELGIRIKHRVKGRPAIEKSLRLLMIRTHRYALVRACTSADQAWASRVIAGLEELIYDAPSKTSEGI